MYMRLAVFRSVRQALRSSGSAGQGACRLLSVWKPPIAIEIALTAKMVSLCSLSQTICGYADTSEARTDPAPMLTSRAGIAQQTRVPDDAKRLTRALKKPDCDSCKSGPLISLPFSLREIERQSEESFQS
jgi:hypothetical protein